eukprot:917741-Pyramimonas_sp.AAC.2
MRPGCAVADTPWWWSPCDDENVEPVQLTEVPSQLPNTASTALSPAPSASALVGCVMEDQYYAI